MSEAPSDWDYRGLAAESYDLWFGDEPYVDQRYYADRIRANGGTALEVACGTGRLLLPYLRDGLAVEGVDASEAMLAICREKAKRTGLAPVLHRQHMQTLSLGQRYRTLFVPSCSFQILERVDECDAALQAFREHLEPGGELLVSLHVPWADFALESQWRLRRSGDRPSDGATVMIHECTRSDRFEQLQSIWLRLEVWKDGQLVESVLRTHTMRWYHAHEFRLRLERAGFREIAAHGGYRPRPARDGDGEIVFSGRR